MRANQYATFKHVKIKALKENRFAIEHSGTSQRDPQSLVQERCCGHANQRRTAN